MRENDRVVAGKSQQQLLPLKTPLLHTAGVVED